MASELVHRGAARSEDVANTPCKRIPADDVRRERCALTDIVQAGVQAHEAAALFPMLGQAELRALAADIREYGQVEPIVLWEGKILDGRNRHAACQLANVEPRFRELTECQSPTAFVISTNLFRRHLTALQRAAAAADSKPMFAEEAKARQSIAGKTHGRGQIAGAPIGHQLEEKSKARDAAAAAFNVGKNAVDAMDRIKADAPDVFAASKSGAIATVEDAKRVASLPTEDRAPVLAAMATGETFGEARRALVRDRISQRDPGAIEGKYRVIYADPPWSYGNAMPPGTTVPADYYPPMSLKEICDMPVKQAVEDDSVLFLWTTSPHLEESFDVIKAWGFSYKTSFVWDKVKHNMGHYNSVRHEFLLVCTRGACTPDVRRLFDSVVTEERTEHSRKPDCFYDIIETLYPHGAKLELFSRRERAGWKLWGFEAPTSEAPNAA